MPQQLTLATIRPGEPEVFASLQGEGPSVGMPVGFMRLSRCNLACVWCDTAYTWHFEGDERPHRSDEQYDRKRNQVTVSIDIAGRLVERLKQNRLVITGGEPLLQAQALAELAKRLDGVAIEIETNGTVDPPARLDVHVDQYNVSPKLAHSGNPAELALIPKLLDRWATDARAYFKFVVASPDDIEEIEALRARHGIATNRLFLMPEGTDAATLNERAEWLAPLCVEHGYRYSDRLHIRLYGDTRGT